MADSTPAPGSRAIKIPLQPNTTTTPSRIRRSHRYTRLSGTAESADAGASSLSSGSDQDSYSNSIPSQFQHKVPTTASPPPHQHTPPPTLASNGPNQRKDKHRADTPPSTMPTLSLSPSSLGPNMLSNSSYKSINLNALHSHSPEDEDTPPRLITYTKHSQGFTWNDELFLPSYLLHSRHGGAARGRKKRFDADFGDDEDWNESEGCRVMEIFVTDEEAQAMMP